MDSSKAVKVLRAVAACVAILAAWLGLGVTAAAAMQSASTPGAIFSCDDLGHAVTLTNTTTERGPPAADDHEVTTYNAVDPRSNGASARPDGPTPSRAFGYDHPVLLVQVASRSSTTQAGADGAVGEVPSLQRAGVAAKGAPDVSQILMRSPGQLQSKFKHAGDFGVTGNYSKANAANSSSAMHQHINGAGTRAIPGTYRGESVTHYLDPATGLNVISRNGEFVSGWQLSPGQLANVLKHGGLGGG